MAVAGFLVAGLVVCQYYDWLVGLLACWVFAVLFLFCSCIFLAFAVVSLSLQLFAIGTALRLQLLIALMAYCVVGSLAPGCSFSKHFFISETENVLVFSISAARNCDLRGPVPPF